VLKVIELLLSYSAVIALSCALSNRTIIIHVLMKLFRSLKFFKYFNNVQALNATNNDTIGSESEDGTDWSTMLPELLADIIKRVDVTGEQWPHRRNVVACASVCKRWRDITREVVGSPSLNGKITFPSCLKQVLQQNEFILFFSLE